MANVGRSGGKFEEATWPCKGKVSRYIGHYKPQGRIASTMMCPSKQYIGLEWSSFWSMEFNKECRMELPCYLAGCWSYSMERVYCLRHYVMLCIQCSETVSHSVSQELREATLCEEFGHDREATLLATCDLVME